jgi:rSAM/selenodomain-associated transferase 1
MMKRALTIVAKRPVAGQTKTRLCPPLAPDEAARLYECFLRDTLDIARAAAVAASVTLHIAYLPRGESPYFHQLAPDFALMPQIGASLGERLDRSLTQCLQDGFARAVVMDSDSPTLPSAYVAQAFDALDDADVTLGPCEDGGYYLIGVRHPQPRLLREVRMSTPNVLRDTLALAEQVGLRVSLLPKWYDVDTVRDLNCLRDELRAEADGVAPHTREFLGCRA